ncbi:hypothetical protein ACWEWD_11820 [Streptomyces tendae]
MRRIRAVLLMAVLGAGVSGCAEPTVSEQFEEILDATQKEGPVPYTYEGWEGFPDHPEGWEICSVKLNNPSGDPSNDPQALLLAGRSFHNPKSGNGISFWLQQYVDEKNAKIAFEREQRTVVACESGELSKHGPGLGDESLGVNIANHSEVHVRVGHVVIDVTSSFLLPRAHSLSVAQYMAERAEGKF